MSFSDAFDRSDGAPGASWSVLGGSWAIVGGKLRASGDGWIRTTSPLATTTQKVTCTPTIVSGSLFYIRLALGGDDSLSTFYAGGLNYTGTTKLWVLFRVTGGVATTIGSFSQYGTYTGGSPINLSFNAGTLVLAENDYPLVTVTGLTQALGTRAGLSCTPGVVDWDNFVADDTGGRSMTVTPDPIWIAGGPQQLVATGVGTTWTVGVPGSSTLTADHGDLSYQYTIDPTHIRFTYEPALWPGPITFTESQYGLTDQINLSLTPPSTYPVGLGLSAEAIAYIERSAVAESTPTIANRQMIVGGGLSDASLLAGLADLRSSVDDLDYAPGGVPGVNRTAWLLWRILNGVNGPPRLPLTTPSDTTLKEDTDAIQAALAALITSNHWTLGNVITEITGSGVPTIRDVLDALDALPGSDLSTVTSRLDAMRGDTTTSLANLLSSLGSIRTVDALSLGDVMDALDNIGGSSPIPTALAVVGLIAALGLAAPTGGASVAAAAIAVGAGPVLDIATIVEIVSLAGEVASLIETITEMRANLITPYHGPPVWPGLDAVSLGEALTLTNGLVVTGPLDGLLFTITEQPEHNQRYLFGTTNSWSRVGAVIFETDNGYWERSQSIALDKHIIVPQTMSRAASAAVRMNANWHGTVRSWVTSP